MLCFLSRFCNLKLFVLLGLLIFVIFIGFLNHVILKLCADKKHTYVVSCSGILRLQQTKPFQLLGKMESLCPASASDSRWFIDQLGKATAWTKEENKQFESALAIYDEKTPNRWFKVAEMIPGKSVYDVINQYRELVADVFDIEAGLVPIPAYLASSFRYQLADVDVCRKRARGGGCDQERKKGVPWTEEEHRRFLMGLQKHGKGDWRNISRNFVISKSPTQVASHAQKYYLRQLSGGKDNRRPSIHDITTIHLATAPPSGENKTPLVEISDNNIPPQKPVKMPKVLMDWNRMNEGTLMVAYGDSLVAYPCNIEAQSWYGP